MNIDTIVDKEYAALSFRALAEAPVSALRGISPKDAKALAQAFDVNSVGDLAKLDFFKWAQAIATLDMIKRDFFIGSVRAQPPSCLRIEIEQ